MTTEVLSHQAGARAQRTGESLGQALKAVLETEAGRRLGALRDGEHCGERADQWQPNLPRERAEKREQHRLKERARLREAERGKARQAAWESFMRQEWRELQLRKDGQLIGLLGAALVGEPPAALRRLASEDQRQAEEEMVALTSNGNLYYKRLGELEEGDMAARIAADRLRTTWLKERRDGWLAYGRRAQEEGSL